ncbi:MAG TPA: glycosyltransferase [Gammaproteobacteria bacterium]
MRVVHIESGLHLYGGAQQVLYLLGGLAAEGIDNVLICPRGSAIADAAGGINGTAEVIDIPMRGDLDIALPGRLRALIESRRPDLVHVHSRRGADKFGGWNARWAGVPAVLTRRVDSAEFRALALLKYQPYAAIIAISRAIETELRDNMGLSERRIHYVASGVDTEQFAPRGNQGNLGELAGLPADALTIGIVAQLIPRKGHERLFRILPRLLENHPRLQVVCFGQGPLRDELDSLRRDLGIEERVHFAGFRADMNRLLPEIDILAHPAEREGLGVAVLEALSCEVAVVASALGGLTDVIEHDVTGLAVAADDDSGWEEALDRMLADTELRRRLGRAGRQRVEAEFSVERMTRGNLLVYREVLRNSYGRN